MSERYQREIEEILRQTGELGSGGGQRGPKKSLKGLNWRRITQSMTPGPVMLIAVAVLLLALVMQAALPGLAAPLGGAGLVMLVVGYAMFFIRPRRVEKRWRGQPIDYRTPGWWDRFLRKVK